ncbi:tail fiber assembly protein [Citrobacter farmeri]|uniref:tail fiber assembly protein n=1 Tax=Citrobacter farmeri TaxID=67824 RepID=UPI003623C94F
MSYLYSATANSFYPKSMKSDYESAGSWPDDAIEVEDSIYEEFTAVPPDGKERKPDESGNPSWADIPPPSKDEQIAVAEEQKKALLLEAQATISLWQTELQLGLISDEDKASLIAWMNYIKAVQEVDTSKAPDITWPDKPE